MKILFCINFHKIWDMESRGSLFAVPVLSNPTGDKIAEIFEALTLQQQENRDVGDANVEQQLEHHF